MEVPQTQKKPWKNPCSLRLAVSPGHGIVLLGVQGDRGGEE